jgi:hypothetical protein
MQDGTRRGACRAAAVSLLEDPEVAEQPPEQHEDEDRAAR